MKDVTLNQREQARLQVLNSVMDYQLPRAQAAELLGISERQLRRVLPAYRMAGQPSQPDPDGPRGQRHCRELFPRRGRLYYCGDAPWLLPANRGLRGGRPHPHGVH